MGEFCDLVVHCKSVPVDELWHLLRYETSSLLEVKHPEAMVGQHQMSSEI